MFEIRNLGTGVPYESALSLQEDLVAQRLLQEIPDTLLLLEHSPVYTIGRTRDRTSLLNPDALPHPLYEISRGGQATYHGPGQLVAYPIINLNHYRKDLHLYLRSLEQSLIEFANSYNVEARQRDGLTGIWTEDRKLASMGVGVKKWTTSHGFALNLRAESLPPFQAITPCGLTGVQMTSLATEGAPKLSLDDCIAHYPSFLMKELENILER